MFYLMSCDAKTVRRTSWAVDISDRYADQEHFETKHISTISGSKFMAQTLFLVTVTFDLCYMLCHTH